MWKFQMPGTLESREDDVALLWDAGASGLEERDGVVVAYFDAPRDLALDGTWAEEPEQDWQAQFKQNLRPVRAGAFTIVPPWLTGEVPADSTPLVIEVGMAFGTGHHETTRMAVETLAALDLGALTPGRPCRVVDVGTGSGVLVLAAALAGAGVGVGVDIDPVTIPAALENAALNGFEVQGDRVSHSRSGAVVTFVEGTLDDLADHPALPADVLVANLYAELHDALMDQYREAVVDGAVVVLTGILVDRLPIVLAALDREGFRDTTVRTENEWALVTARA